MECPDRRGLVVWLCRCCCDGLDVLDADSEDSWLVGREGGVDDQGRNAAAVVVVAAAVAAPHDIDEVVGERDCEDDDGGGGGDDDDDFQADKLAVNVGVAVVDVLLKKYVIKV